MRTEYIRLSECSECGPQLLAQNERMVDGGLSVSACQLKLVVSSLKAELCRAEE